jgi:hypothetical protein
MGPRGDNTTIFAGVTSVGRSAASTVDRVVLEAFNAAMSFLKAEVLNAASLDSVGAVLLQSVQKAHDGIVSVNPTDPYMLNTCEYCAGVVVDIRNEEEQAAGVQPAYQAVICVNVGSYALFMYAITTK